MDIENQKNRLLDIIQDRYKSYSGSVEKNILQVGDQAVSLIPLLKSFQHIQKSRLFTRLPPLFDSTENFPISDMYVELAVAQSQGLFDPLRLTRGLTLAEEQEKKHQQRRAKGLSIEQCVNNQQHHNIVILGDPGSGKTSLLKYLCLQIAKGNNSRWVLPIFISLRQYWVEKKHSPHLSLLQYATTFFEIQKDRSNASSMFACNEEEKQKNIDDLESVLSHISSDKHEHILFLLDGLDEIASQADAIETISEEIRQLGYRFSWILTSRYTGFYNGLGEDICYEIVSLNKQGVEDLVTQWFKHADPSNSIQKKQLILKQIQENPRLNDMARNPFLLTLLCYVQNISQQQFLPVQRTDVYAEIIKLIREQLRSVKHDVKAKLFRKNELDYLAKFCYYLYTQAENSPLQLFDYDHWDACAEPNNPPDLDKHFLSSRLLNSWKQKGDFHFTHLTFQEYFIALHLSHLDTTEIKEYLFNPQWKMVYRFLVGIYGKRPNKVDYTNLIKSLLNPVDKMGLLYIEAAHLLVESGVENSTPILGYDLREKLWNIWCQGSSYASNSAGDALTILSPNYVIRTVITLLQDEKNKSLAKRSITLLGNINTVDADELMLDLFQANDSQYQDTIVDAIAEKNTAELRTAMIELYQNNNMKQYLPDYLFKLAKITGHTDFLPYLEVVIKESNGNFDKISFVFSALESIGTEEVENILWSLIKKTPLENISSQFLEAFISLKTERVKKWTHNALACAQSGLVKRKLIVCAIQYGLLSNQATVEALYTDDILSQSRYINAIYIQKNNGIQVSDIVIQAMANIAFSEKENSVRAFTILVTIDNKTKQRNLNINKYKTNYRRFLKHEDMEMVMTAISILAELQDILSFQAILDLAKTDPNTGIKIEAISALGKYHDIFPSEVEEALHFIYQQEKEKNNSYISGEALGTLAKISINEVIPYYHDEGAENILTYFCSTEGILLFNDYYIDRYGKQYSWHGVDKFSKLNSTLEAITQLEKIRMVCIYLLNNNHAVKTGHYHRGHEPIPLFKKNTATYNTNIPSIDINTGKRLLSGKKLRADSATRLMQWLETNFNWVFNK